MRSISNHPEHRHRGWTSATFLLVTLLVVGCDAGPVPSTAPTTPASAATASHAAPASTERAPTLSPGPTSTSTPLAAPTPPPSAAGPLVPGALAVTVSDRLRVRSEPRVASDSLRYEPVLPVGTQLVVAAGPVDASGYTWFRVAPLGVSLAGGVDQGWVAVADHDNHPAHMQHLCPHGI